MKQLLTFLQIGLFSLAFITAQATDRETRNLDSFSGISVSSGVDAKLIKGNTNEIQITVKGIELERIKTQIKNDVLVVSVKNKRSWFSRWNKKDIDVVITYSDDLDRIAASSGSNLYSDHTLVTEDLEIDASSGAHIDVEVDAQDVDIDISSGSVVDLRGTGSSVYVDSSSGSSLRAYDLVTDRLNTEGSSGSSVQITVLNNLKVDVSSGASVQYRGNPENKDIDKSSGGSVRQVSKGV